MSLREAICADGKLKALSLLLAVTLWLFVTLESHDETDVPLTITPVNLPPGLSLETPLPAVSLRIAGPRTLLIRQKWQDAPLTLDFAGAGVGTVTFTGLERRVRLLPGVRAATVLRDLELRLIRQ